MKRRHLLVLSAAPVAFSPSLGFGQLNTSSRIPTVGILSDLPVAPPGQTASSPFWAPLAELGWVEGKTLRIERASAERQLDRLPGLAQRLVAAKVDVIFAVGNEATVSAARATKSIPIVFWGVNYPVEIGLVNSLARPGGNVTGVALYVGPEESSKTLDFLREVAPATRQLAYLFEPMLVQRVVGNASLPSPDAMEQEAQLRGFMLERYPARNELELRDALDRMARSKVEALFSGYSHLTIERRSRIAEFALGALIPSAANDIGHVQVGGLLSYGSDILERFRQAAALVDRVLRGRRPSDIPVDLPSTFHLAVNTRTGKSLGLTIPKSLLLRATHVIN
jgi:putative ABC transport system substrate-binding protein